MGRGVWYNSPESLATPLNLVLGAESRGLYLCGIGGLSASVTSGLRVEIVSEVAGTFQRQTSAVVASASVARFMV
jgi:hypothetical protein